jgi:hypothetical protein
MTTSDDTHGSSTGYTIEEFVARLQSFIASRDDGKEQSDRSDDCALVVTDTGLDLCCTVKTDTGLEVECTDVLDILKPE